MKAPTELTEKALSKRLLTDTTNHPLTLSSGVTGVLGGAAAVMFASSELFLGLAAIGGLGILTSVGFIAAKTIFGRSKSMLEIVEKVRSEVMAQRAQIAQQLRKTLEEFGDSRGLTQLDQLKAKFSAFEKVLALQFDADELTFKRYLTTAEQLYFGTVDNMRKLAVSHHSLSAIDIRNIETKLVSEALSEGEREAFTERKKLYEQGRKNQEAIYSVNEQAMTKLDELTNKLGSIQTRDGVADVKLETAMKEILYLINRTDQYDINS